MNIFYKLVILFLVLIILSLSASFPGYFTDEESPEVQAELYMTDKDREMIERTIGKYPGYKSCYWSAAKTEPGIIKIQINRSPDKVFIISSNEELIKYPW